MKPGGGKSKGSAYEREICNQLSLWITNGADSTAFWRSAMSGGRATLLARTGKRGANVAGDICATSKAGHKLTDCFYCECKSYANIDIQPFIFGLERGKLWKFWEETCKQAATHNKKPLLIVKQNYLPSFVMTIQGGLLDKNIWPPPASAIIHLENGISIYWLDDIAPIPKPTIPPRRQHNHD